MKRELSGAALFVLLAVPFSADAQTLSQGVALFNILTGLMITAAFVSLAGGFASYLCRLGNVNREEGLKIMKWGVTILFVLIILLAIAGFIEKFF